MMTAAAKSNAHPDVVNYRRRLDSAEYRTEAQIAELRASVEETVRLVKTPVPPPPDDDDDEGFDAREAPTVKNGLGLFPAKPPRP